MDVVLCVLEGREQRTLCAGGACVPLCMLEAVGVCYVLEVLKGVRCVNAGGRGGCACWR